MEENSEGEKRKRDLNETLLEDDKERHKQREQRYVPPIFGRSSKLAR